jgi:hypothetical protein
MPFRPPLVKARLKCAAGVFCTVGAQFLVPRLILAWCSAIAGLRVAHRVGAMFCSVAALQLSILPVVSVSAVGHHGGVDGHLFWPAVCMLFRAGTPYGSHSLFPVAFVGLRSVVLCRDGRSVLS